MKELKWQKGFICPRCGHDHSHYISTHQLYQCSSCQHQTSVTAGTLFHRSHLSLQKWFWAVYFVGSDKGSISAVRLSQLIDVHWRTARLVLKKLRKAIGNKDSLYYFAWCCRGGWLATLGTYCHWQLKNIFVGCFSVGTSLIALLNDIEILRPKSNVYELPQWIQQPEKMAFLWERVAQYKV